ncbi:aquaporin, partial [Salmonella enterica subsp. enterica serovar Anatum]|nr:aquaporin [Salmonella enterica subsp. enterica serovar Anatum]
MRRTAPSEWGSSTHLCCIAEFLGTGLLIFFGVGCVAALKVAGATFGQWEISVIWGLGV